AAAFREARALKIDGLISAGGATPELVEAMERAGPFGSASPEPVLAVANHTLDDASIVGVGGHVRCRLKAGDGAILNGIAFRAAAEPLGMALKAAVGQRVHAAGTLSIDRWGGAARAQLRIIDAAAALPA
ncbi:MAG: single-stranded-DNA-specific exonuclease RecJ, partial [Beijerinckiaceae bacterium]